MALTENTPVVLDVSQSRGSVPAAANVTVYEGSLIGDVAGYGRPLVAGDRFRGHAIEKIVNGATAGEKNITVLSGRYRLEVALAGAVTDVGRRVYASDDGTLTLTATGNSHVGHVIRYVDAATMIVEFVTWFEEIEFPDEASLVKYFDDFFEYDDTATVGKWVVVEDAGAAGGDVLTDAAGGVLSIGCDGDDNDECYVASIAEIFKFQTDKRLTFEARVKLTEANDDDANFIIGLSNTVAADSLLDNGGGPMASYDGAVFFKVDGGTKIQFESSNAAAQVTNNALADFESGEWVTLKFAYDYNDGVTGKITPYVDGVAGTVHDITIAGLEEMHVLMGVKAGGANEEALLVDYVKVTMDR